MPAYPSPGWCVETEWFQGQPSVCCSSDAPHTDDVACFSSLPHPTTNIDRCIDPIPVMTDHHRKRCSSRSACAENSTCITYTSSNPLLRIEINKDKELKTVVWSGPRLEVWEQVEVGELRPRAFIYPLWLPNSLASYMSYLKMIMLSLFVMNLFPLSFLDGGQVLRATADLVLKDSEKTQDLEAGGRGFRSLGGGGRMGRRKNLIKSSAEVGTWVLIGTSSTLGLVHWYRS